MNLGVDPDCIAAGGGSVGAHVAALTAASVEFEEPNEDKSISAKPNALVLLYPGTDAGPGTWLHRQYQEHWEESSALLHIETDTPPTIILHGAEDELFPVSEIEAYKQRMTEVGARCDVWIFDGQKHGFDHYRDGTNPYYNATIFLADEFLASLGYLNGRPTIENKEVELMFIQ